VFGLESVPWLFKSRDVSPKAAPDVSAVVASKVVVSVLASPSFASLPQLTKVPITSDAINNFFMVLGF
jgi:hypothetical protein